MFISLKQTLKARVDIYKYGNVGCNGGCTITEINAGEY